MKPRQLNLFADKKHYREMNARLQKEIREIMERQKPKPEQKARTEPGCGVRP